MRGGVGFAIAGFLLVYHNGALALALRLNLTTAFPCREQILNLTFGVVIFSILVQGLTIKPLVRILKLASGDDAKAA